MSGWSKQWFIVERRAGGHLRYFWFCRFFGAKLPPPPPCTLSKEEVLCHSCDMGVSQFCHVLLVVSRLCHSCDNARHHMTIDNEISSLEHLLCDTLWHDIMWHTVTQMSHTIAQKCHTYDEPVTLEILVDIDTCRFRWFSIRLVFGSIRSIGQLVAGQED